jgi:hypothetical protein
VICELAWILDRRYGQTRAEICEALERVLRVELFRFEHESLVRRSLEMFRTGKAHFADYLIGEICRQAGSAIPSPSTEVFEGLRDTLSYRPSVTSPGGWQLNLAFLSRISSINCAPQSWFLCGTALPDPSPTAPMRRVRELLSRSPHRRGKSSAP